MRVYLRTFIETNGATDFNLLCLGCQKEKRVVDYYEPSLRPITISSINAMRLIEIIGNFLMEHSDCPSP